MPFNGSEIIDDPVDTIFSPFTDLLGNVFWLFPITFLAIALYVKTRNMISVFAFLIGSCSLLSAGNMFISNPEMAFIYFIFSMLAVAGLILSVLFIKR